MMKRFLALLVALVCASPAFGITVNGYLKKAALEPLSSDPSTTLTGRVYWNTTNGAAKVWDGAEWTTLGSGSATSPTVYSQPPVAVTAVGTAGFPQLGHVLDQKDFTAETSAQYAFWNLAANPNDGGPQGLNLTPNGTPTYTTTNVLGTTNAAATLNGTSQYFSSTNSFFNPGNKSFALGGWFYSPTWNCSGGSQDIMAQEDTSSNPGFALVQECGGTTNVGFRSSASAFEDQPEPQVATGWSNSTWHHIAVVYDANAQKVYLYLDGKLGTWATKTSQGSVTTPGLKIGARFTTASNFWNGSAEDVFFQNSGATTGALTADDIRKLAARRFDHNLAIAPEAQVWNGTWQRADQQVAVPLDSSWVVSKGNNSLWADFSGVASGAYVAFKAQDLATTPASIPTKSYDSGWLLTTPATTIPHGLGAIPTSGSVCYVTNYGATGAAQCYPLSNYCSADNVDLYCDWTGLSVGSGNQVDVQAWQAGAQTAMTAASASTSGVVNTTSQTFAGAKFFSSGITGVTDGSDACPGCVGEYKEINLISGAFPPASGQWYNTSTLAMPAGDWDVTGGIVNTTGGCTALSLVASTVGSVSNAVPSDAIEMRNWCDSNHNVVECVIPRYRISKSSAWTLYAVISLTTGSSCTYHVSLTARRVR